MTLFFNTIQVINAAFWDLFQFAFGANTEKCRIYRDTVACISGSSILDFGCATGITASAFLDCDYLGVDINAGAIKWAQYKYKKFNNVKFRCCDVNTLKGKSFQHILCAGTGHHLTDVELIGFHNVLESLLAVSGTINFIDIVKTNQDTLIMRGLMAIDQGRHIRSSEEYIRLFETMDNVKIAKKRILRADGWFTKPSFVCLNLVRSAEITLKGDV